MPESELPEGWVLATLADVTERVANVKPEDQPHHVFGYVDISSICNESNRITDHKRFSGSEAPSRARRPIQPGDVLFSNVRTYLRNVAVVLDGLAVQVCSTGFTVLRSNGAVDPGFLFRYVLTDEFIDRVTPQQTGTHYPAASDRKVLAEAIPLAPLAEQKRIVAMVEKLLARVNAARERLARVPAILKRFRQSVLAAACSGRLTADWRDAHPDIEPAADLRVAIATKRRALWETGQAKSPRKRRYPAPVPADERELPRVPDAWDWVSADEICSQITDGEHIQPRYQPTGRPMLTAKHVRDGFMVFDDGGLISEKDFKKCLERCAATEGDILIVSVGATTGRAAIVRDCPPFALVRSVLLLRPLVPSSFFLRWTQSPWCQEWISQASGASAQPHFYIRDTRRMPVPLPPLVEQHEIVRRVEALFKLADTIEQRVQGGTQRADKLTQAVLAKAFRGELVPTEAELARREGRPYEPASVLLERIKAERAASAKPRMSWKPGRTRTSRGRNRRA